MKRPSRPAQVAVAASLVVALSAIVVVAPDALAAPWSSATPFVGRPAVAAPSAAATLAPPDPTASPSPSPSPSPSLSTPSPTPSAKPTAKPKVAYRDTVANARLYVKNRIGIKQYNCINDIWYHESRWNPRAMYPASGDPTKASYGIPQAHPGIKMAAYGSNWRTSPLTQVRWGLWYVTNRYGSACGAYAFKKKYGWY